MKRETVLGIDFGEANLGIAIGSEGLTMPLSCISGKNITTAIHEIVRLSYENKVSRIIIGMPLLKDGKEGRKSFEIRRFANLLRIRAKKPVEFVDESFSTLEAIDRALYTDVSKKRRQTVDSISAEIILKRYFEKEG